MAFTLKQVVPWGRSFEEYVRMFDIGNNDLRRKIISCGDGPAGFNAEMRKQGYRVVSCDPIYRFSAKQIESRIDRTYKLVLEQLKENRKDYVWKSFKTPEEVGDTRMRAMRSFLEDYDRGKEEGRYVNGSLPELAFKEGEFDLALCSHFLFLYTGQLSLDFHVKAILEMLRIAKEARIFPLLELGGRKSPYVEYVLAELKKKGYRTSVSGVNYEFQRGGDRMLRIDGSA